MTNTYDIINHTTGEVLQFEVAQGENLWVKVAEYTDICCWKGDDLTLKKVEIDLEAQIDPTHGGQLAYGARAVTQ